MKGRLKSTLWVVILMDVVALFTVFFLAYSAGATAKVPIGNIGHLEDGADLKVLFALVICAGAFVAGITVV